MKENQAEREKTLKNPSLWYLLLRPAFTTIVLARVVLMFTFKSALCWMGDYL